MTLMLPSELDSAAMFDGLPLHPLVGHLPVVVLPLTAILLVGCAVLPALRRRLLGLCVLGAALGQIGVMVAMGTGDELGREVGMPVAHEGAAHRLLVASISMLVLSLGWWITRRLAERRARVRDAAAQSGGRRAVTGVLSVVLAAATAAAAPAVLVFAYQTGHSGAEEVWAGQVAATEAADTASSSASAPASGAGTSAAPSGQAETGAYSMSEVSTHDSAESCWSAIDGEVYDLSDWIDQHPGGQSAIESLCGSDGTEAFTAQHDGNTGVAEQLSEFRIGQLAS